MKNNQLIAMLVGILFITTGAAGWLSLRYTSALRTRQSLEARLAGAPTAEAAINTLATEVVEYAKKNPAIDPILKSFNLLPGGNPPVATGTRPATR